MHKYYKLSFFGLAIVGLWSLMGCQSNQIESPDCTVNPIIISLQSKTDANCGDQNGEIIVNVTGGSGEYTFAINGNVVRGNIFRGLAAGLYIITATDEKRCEALLEVTVINTNGVEVTDIATVDAGCGSRNGSITVTAAAGTPPYRYQLGNSGFQTSNVFSNLLANRYKLTVTDAQDCDFTADVVVPSGVQLVRDVMPIINANCAVSGCHNGSRAPNLSTPQGVISSADRVRIRTAQGGGMPPSGPLPASLRDAIACWVNDGAPNN